VAFIQHCRGEFHTLFCKEGVLPTIDGPLRFTRLCQLNRRKRKQLYLPLTFGDYGNCGEHKVNGERKPGRHWIFYERSVSPAWLENIPNTSFIFSLTGLMILPFFFHQT
jgi:hypothetical protein